MATSTAATISQRCLLHTKTTNKDTSTVYELTVSKADNRGLNNDNFHTLKILREIPTRISTLTSTAAADDLPNDDDDRRQHQSFPSPSINLEESTSLPHPRPSSSNDIELLTQMLAATDTKMRQLGLLPLQAPEPNCAANDDTPYIADSKPPALSSLLLTTTLEKEDALFAKLDIFEQGLLDRLKTLSVITEQHSQALCTLTTICDGFSTMMTRFERVIDTILPAPIPNHSAPVPSLHPMDTTDTTIPLTPTPAPEKQKLPFPPNQYRNNPHRPTDATPWPPPPPALFSKPAQKLKTPTQIKKTLAKPSVVRGCIGKSRTKDNLRPP